MNPPRSSILAGNHEDLQGDVLTFSVDELARLDRGQGAHHDVSSPSARPSSAPGLPRRRSRYLRNGSSPRSIPATPRSILSTPVSASDALVNSAETQPDPMQRWRDSPPETEAASLHAIMGALTSLPTDDASDANRRRSWADRSASTTRSNSVTACSSGTMSSAYSGSASHSQNRSLGQRRVSKRRTQKEKIKPAHRAGNADKKKRPFQCTFCADTFRSKYDWSRHERTLHLNLETWVCSPHGGIMVSPINGRSHCSYCNMLDPDMEHLASHKHGICHGSGKGHTFARKDHLVQHLRLVHHVETMPIIDDWKSEIGPVVSRCGFCDTFLDTWPERVEHLAQHFRTGATMKDWKGDHCFEPSVAALVTQAVPPYMIAIEQSTHVPFSATSVDARDHCRQVQQAAGSWELPFDLPLGAEAQAADGEDGFVPRNLYSQGGQVDAPHYPDPHLTADDTINMFEVIPLHLARYARQMMRQGVIPTDAMFQEECRKLIYNSSDPWEQTIADNSEWLSAFRSQIAGPAQGSKHPDA